MNKQRKHPKGYGEVIEQILAVLYSNEVTSQDFKIRIALLVDCLSNELARTDIENEDIGPVMEEFTEAIVQNVERIRREGQKPLFHFSRKK